MVKKGHYPLEPADQNMTSKVGAVYQVAPENQEQIQQNISQYQNPTHGSSDQLFQ